MLVCPHCQFENPNTNKFCQECGVSLTQNTCPGCMSLVPFESVNCQTCGAIAGIIWRAIIVDSPSIPVDSPIQLALPQRYRLLEPLALDDPAAPIRVLDCQPFQLSSLEVQAGNTLDSDDTEALHVSTAAIAAPDGSTTQESGGECIKTLVIPSAAKPYLELQHKLQQALPVVHDAWQQAGQQVVLLEDRSHFPRLIDLWADEELSLPALQILHWLYEMIELWHALEPWSVRQSLLEATNLCIDEDQVLCLQRLYPEPTDATLTLQDLGHVWQSLFAQSQRTQFGEISLLLADVEAGVLTTIADVRSRIEAIAHDLQATADLPDSPAEPTAMETVDSFNDDTPALEANAADLSTALAPTRLEVPLPDLAAMKDDDDGESDDLPTIVLPMQLFSLDDVGRTDIGRQRDHNEDYFGIETQISRLESPSGRTVHARNLYILCDGMGGHAGGEVASALAVDTLRRYFRDKWQNTTFPAGGNSQLPTQDVLIEAVQLANKAIYDVNQQNARSGSGRMGTTLVMLLVQDTEVAIAHVGDSRLYRYTRKRGLEQITIDHEVGQREIQRGVDPDIAYARPDAYQLTQALGPRDEHFIKPDVQYLELNEDTLLLLCSDGLTDNDLLENHWQSHIEPLVSSQANLDQGVRQLIDLANQYNGHDNITAIAVRAKVRPNLEHLR